MGSAATGPLAGFAEAVERTPFAIWATESALVYPVANTAHVIGAILLVGSIGILDLRLLGYARGAPVPVLALALTPLAVAGFGVMVVSGAVLFASDPVALAGSVVFGVKLGLILLAGVNAVMFRLGFGRIDDPVPGRARALAGLSLALWLSVVVAGRWIAYA